MSTKTNSRAIIATIIAVLGTGSLLWLSLVLGQQQNKDLGLYFLYQLITLGISLLVILAMWFTTGKNLTYLRRGNMSAPATPVKLLGISAKDNWKRIGLTFLVAISLVTLVFLLIADGSDLGSVPLGSWALAFAVAIPLSVVNAFNEEIITRWTIAEGFAGKLARYAPWVSAVIFGSVHYFGIPGGLIGSLMAGFLAWFATRSIQDTRGLGWAWLIHFAQDMLILTITIAVFI